ncbi:hypothetical protein [Nocardia altamirensis]|uniref:hypothetical protein n=1 Tax=Nocardia altamirensis TaxID=472158 RepID=UPI0008404448|nr:hypothetical protein [Nocardia altamirensis]
MAPEPQNPPPAGQPSPGSIIEWRGRRDPTIREPGHDVGPTPKPVPGKSEPEPVEVRIPPGAPNPSGPVSFPLPPGSPVLENKDFEAAVARHLAPGQSMTLPSGATLTIGPTGSWIVTAAPQSGPTSGQPAPEPGSTQPGTTQPDPRNDEPRKSATPAPTMQFPPGTDADTQHTVQAAMDRLWAALGRSAPVTAEPAPVPGGVPKSDPGIGGYGNVVDGQRTVRDQFVAAETRLAQLLAQSAQNTETARKAVLDCVEEFNTAVTNVDTSTPAGQKVLLTRIQTALDTAQNAVQQALTNSPKSAPTVPKDGTDGKDTPVPVEPAAPGTDGGWKNDPTVDTDPDPFGAPLDSYPSLTTGDPYEASPYPMSPLPMNPYAMNPYGAGMYGANPMGANPLGANPLGTNPLGTLPGLLQALSGIPQNSAPATSPSPATTAPSPVPAAPATANSPTGASVVPEATMAPPPSTTTAVPGTAPAPPSAPTTTDPGATAPSTAPSPPAAAEPNDHPGTDQPKSAEAAAENTSTVKLPDGSEQQAPNPQAAQAVRQALLNADNTGDAAQTAYAGTGVNLPAGRDPGAPVDPADLAPGDVAVWGDHTAIVASRGNLIDHGKVVPIAELMNTGADFKGFFRPTDTTAPATTPDSAPPASKG